jgi:hypothetical protein
MAVQRHSRQPAYQDIIMATKYPAGCQVPPTNLINGDEPPLGYIE